MKQAFPQYLTVSNGFDDSVQILKNRGMISENKLKDIRPVQNLADNFPLNTIERGIDYELEKAGIDPTGTVTKEQYVSAKQKCMLNLQKDQAFYYNLMSGDSANVDKHDKMKETKRGAKEADTFNAMKKATLKEAIDPTLDPYEDKKEIVRQVIDLVKREKSVPNSVAVDFIKTHYEDIINLRDDEAILDEFEEFFSVNYESGSDYNEVMGVDRKGNKKPETDGSDAAKYKRAAKGLEEDEEEYLAKKDAAIKQAMGKEDEVEEGRAVNAYTPGDMFSTDFDYEGMLKAGLKVRVNTPVDVMQKIYDSFEDVNYHRENTHLGDVIDAVKEGNREEALEALKKYRRAIKDTMSDIFEGAFPVRERDESYVPRNGAVVSERVGGLQEFISLIQDRAAENDTSEREEAEEVMYAIGDHYNIGVDIMKGPWDDDNGVNEKKGKDHDGDGDVDGDDYMHAKDKAIKKAMGKDEQLKEAIKGLIKKSLNEDTINEAATQELAALADTYGGYKGMQVVLNDLQNIVTDIESYQAKTKEKLQNVFNKVGDVENEDGLKVGAFLAPAIESAFNKDSRMVGGNRLMKGVNIPKVKFMSKDIETPQNETSPKQTVFAPVKRYF